MFGIERLGDVLVGPGLHGVEGVARVAVGGEDDQADGELLSPDLGQELKPSHDGHSQIGDDEVEVAGVEPRHRGVAVGHGLDLVPVFLQDIAEVFPIDELVVDDENPSHQRPLPGEGRASAAGEVLNLGRSLGLA